MYQHNVCTVLTSSVLQTSYVSRIEFDASQETSTLSFVHFTRVPHANGDGVRSTKIARRANDNSTHVIITQWPRDELTAFIHTQCILKGHLQIVMLIPLWVQGCLERLCTVTLTTVLNYNLRKRIWKPCCVCVCVQSGITRDCLHYSIEDKSSLPIYKCVQYNVYNVCWLFVHTSGR